MPSAIASAASGVRIGGRGASSVSDRWTALGGRPEVPHAADPDPDAADAMADGIVRLREATGFEVLPENPPGQVYLGDLHLLDFFARVIERADTGMLLDCAHLAIYQRLRGRRRSTGSTVSRASASSRCTSRRQRAPSRRLRVGRGRSHAGRARRHVGDRRGGRARGPRAPGRGLRVRAQPDGGLPRRLRALARAPRGGRPGLAMGIDA